MWDLMVSVPDHCLSFYFAIHREICVHLAEISTSDTLHNGRPCTLLRSLPVKNEKCGGGRTETFPILQYKRLLFYS